MRYTTKPGDLSELTPAYPGMEDISCTPNF